ncbi:MAG: FO synthase [Chitinophagales bacterium]|jgi:FO synthase
MQVDSLLQQVLLDGQLLSDTQALELASCVETKVLMQASAKLRDQGFNQTITYSRKVFFPLTQLCRDVCHYCTFATTPKKVENPYMKLADIIEQAKAGVELGCKEALFTLGEKPELRYTAAREALAEMGFATTLEYVAAMAKAVFEETGMLVHINAGCMTADEVAMLRPVSASMGIMLESASARLTEKDMPHYGSPDKEPLVRLETIAEAGRQSVPFTSGILIGIGETRLERIESLLALRKLHAEFGHLQEIIVQNFRAKADTKMAQAPEPNLDELLWTIAVARIVFGPAMSIQAPPNLSPGVFEQIVAAGINDWGGISPLTPDYVNPEAPWPHLDQLATETAACGKHLIERLTIYPQYARQGSKWLDKGLQQAVIRSIDGEGYPRTDDWLTGEVCELPNPVPDKMKGAVSDQLKVIIAKAGLGQKLAEDEIARLFKTRGAEFDYVCASANKLRQQVNGDTITYVVNRNINYTNICYFKCQFCAFSKGKLSENLRGRPYDLSDQEIGRRVTEAWQRGATEVCMQGGIHPEYDGEKYLQICQVIKQAAPDVHIHAFSPLEVWQGAQTLNISLTDYLIRLKQAGLATLPGTAAEILDDEIRKIICPDKLNTGQWLEVLETAHQQGFKTTSTIMYGHVEGYEHWARHLNRVRTLQETTGGITEFVPLPFVASEAPLYLKGKARKGPTYREAVLMHAVARLALHGQIDNIQTSWVKMGAAGAKQCLNAGVNDLGGSLMNESITRAAGALHGQEMPPSKMEAAITEIGRNARQRNTVYGTVTQERLTTSHNASELTDIANTPARKYERAKSGKKVDLIKLKTTA